MQEYEFDFTVAGDTLKERAWGLYTFILNCYNDRKFNTLITSPEIMNNLEWLPDLAGPVSENIIKLEEYEQSPLSMFSMPHVATIQDKINCFKNVLHPTNQIALIGGDVGKIVIKNFMI